MNRPLLILDSDYLCHRSYYAMGSLRHEGSSTGVLFGFLRDIVTLQEKFSTDRIVFAFDHGTSLRRNDLACYKRKREASKVSPEEYRSKRELRQQMCLLRDKYLSVLGFNNVFHEPGYEADDIIASLCNSYGDEEIIIVSADKDLYQLLSDERVKVYHPQRNLLVDKALFKFYYGVIPHWWVRVKAIAGCSTDDIPGIKGVGEKTACKFLRGELKPSSKSFIAINSNLSVMSFNMKLVELPYPGTPEYHLREDNVTRDKWRSLTERLGMKTLVNQFPLSCRIRRKTDA